MRKSLLILISIGMFFSQQAANAAQCGLKPGNKIHCSACVTLEDFAFYGASALYSAGQQRSIQVTGANGSDVYVSKGTYWERADLGVELGAFGRWGLTTYYPSLTYAGVRAWDINSVVRGSLPNDGRMLYGALKAKCAQIEKEKAAMETASDLAREAGHVNRGLFVGIQGVSTSYLQGLIDSGNVATNAVNVYWEQVYDIGGHH